MNVFYETSLWAFLLITVAAGGGAAFVIGRSQARAWEPLWRAALFCLLLGAAVRFLHWGLLTSAALESWRAAQGTLLSARYYLSDTAWLIGFAALGFQAERASQMTRQYGWLYKRVGVLFWRARPEP